MKTRAPLLVLVVLVFGVLLATAVALPARAASDTVERLDAKFEVRADGTIGVTYTLDWDFGEKGRRGIEFGINTREPWDQERGKDVVYGVSNIRVHSPSGAPATFTEMHEDSGSYGELRLRIGDADQPLEDRRATYVISYDLHGALRTFDGVPELHWDITSRDYPPIDEFAVTVTGPESIDRALCHVGGEECEASVSDGVATLSGSRVPERRAITAVASFPEGSVQNARPTLEEEGLSSAQLTEFDAVYEVAADASVQVRHTMNYRLPDDPDYEWFTYRIPVRAPYDSTQDQLFAVSDVAVTIDGEPFHDVELQPGGTKRRDQNLTVGVFTPVSGEQTTVVLRYTVNGAIRPGNPDESRAQFRWEPAHDSLYDVTRSSWTWMLPGPVEDVSCLRMELDKLAHRPCDLPGLPRVDGNTVVLEAAENNPFSSLHLLVAEFPSSAVNVSPLLEQSQDITNRNNALKAWGAALAGALSATGVLWALGSVTLVRDRRFAGVPPGVTGKLSDVATSGRNPQVPVQFHPPSVELAVAGLVLDRRFDARHTAAMLTQLAVKDVVTLSSAPFTISTSRNSAGATVERALRAQIAKHDPVRLSDKTALRALNRAVHTEQNKLLADPHYFYERDEKAKTVRTTVLVILGSILAIGAFVVMGNSVDAGNTLLVGLAGGLSAGAVAGTILGARRTRRLGPALAPNGTALRDQVRGFRTYIATAEAEQLSSEADDDIYRTYLPWAVLFGLTERWTRVCRDLAAVGSIPPLEQTLVGGLAASAISTQLSGFQQQSAKVSHFGGSGGSGGGSSSSSGGSGGSSGFSGGGGGSGGGGTSASSW